ncbi:hypothetical protein [Geobacter anodireducens]|uniref:hypothetical protein n=1 Tax=Geobacter soli TaxID=1510391 RepID=UPI00057E708B|nr:hypothetical protein [Geobacter soli]
MNKYFRVNQIIPHIFPVAKGTWWAWVKDHPEELTPTKLGPRTTVWSEQQLKAFAEKQKGGGR